LFQVEFIRSTAGSCHPIFVHQRHGPHVTDAGVFQPRNNIVSADHHATRLKLRLTRHLSKSKKAQMQSETVELLFEDPINWSILHKDKLKRQEYADKIETILFEYADCDSHEASPTQLSEAIMYATESTITEAKDRETNWFNASESIIRPLRDTAQQRAYKNFLADGSNANRQHWQASCRCYH
jgi:hypothetical protein